MTRKDTEKEAERPHYYSQFWLDVAAGRRIIGAPKPNEENDLVENEPVEAAPARKIGRASEEQAQAVSDGRTENIVHPVAEPVIAPEEDTEPEEEEEPFNGDLENSEVQNVDDSDIPDMDLGSAEEEVEGEEEEEDFFDEEEEEVEGEEEEEEEEEWGGRGSRKKAKPARPTRPPKKPIKRDTRRGY
jgi:hypothetical protein